MFAAPPPPAGSRDALARLGWQDFEHLLSEHYRDQGYRVELAAPAPSLKSLGSGIDLRLRRGSESLIVQCRHWDALEVDAPEVSELLSIMLNEASTGGVLVTRGRFSAQAQALARRQPRLQLVDGELLRVMLKLPDHLDARVPGVAASVARKAAPARRQSSHASSSRLLPIGLGVIILLLIGVLAWRMSGSRTPPAPVAVTPSPAPAAPASLGADLVGDARSRQVPSPTKSAPTRSAVPETAMPVDPGADASRELAARARLRESSNPGRETHTQSDDAMKVMEGNTREVGASR